LFVGRTTTILTIFFWIGGWFAFMYGIGYYITHLIYPHFTYLSIITRLF